ncbi:MAG: phosphonate metabolism protein/1,5-bisphosphokinase (PRPP-forming) PhnN [Phyllobacterium sp.]
MASASRSGELAAISARTGAFVAVVGPSGAGKDTIIDYARAAFDGDPRFVFVRRVVTRPSSADAEDHDTLSEEQFLAADRQGRFSHCWQAHGLHYALPRSIDDEIGQGAVAIANVSRGILPVLRSAYARFAIVHITASHAVLASRLAARGRENADQIQRRLMRAAPNACDPDDAIMIDNSGKVARAGDQFVAVLTKMAAKAAISENI